MFRAVTETDKTYNKIQKHYYLTQGDSKTIRSTPKDSAGNVIMPIDINKCIFKISDLDNNEELKKELPEEDGKYVCRLSSEDTAKLEVGKHIYEFEYTLVGGEVNTPNRWYFDITDQILG